MKASAAFAVKGGLWRTRERRFPKKAPRS